MTDVPKTTTQADDAMPKIVLTVPTNAVSVHYEMLGGSADEPGWVNLVICDADGAVIQKVRAVGGTKDHPLGNMVLERVGAGGGGGTGLPVSATGGPAGRGQHKITLTTTEVDQADLTGHAQGEES